MSKETLGRRITDSPWATAPVWAQLRAAVPVRRGVLAVDDTSFPKQGKRSVGVQRQYCGALGKIANCQVAVSTVLFGAQLTWPLSFELYLPHDWCADPARRTAARAGRPPVAPVDRRAEAVQVAGGSPRAATEGRRETSRPPQ